MSSTEVRSGGAMGGEKQRYAASTTKQVLWWRRSSARREQGIRAAPLRGRGRGRGRLRLRFRGNLFYRVSNALTCTCKVSSGNLAQGLGVRERGRREGRRPSF